MTAEEVAELVCEYLDAKHAGRRPHVVNQKRCRFEAAALNWRLGKREQQVSTHSQVGSESAERQEIVA